MTKLALFFFFYVAVLFAVVPPKEVRPKDTLLKDVPADKHKRQLEFRRDLKIIR